MDALVSKVEALAESHSGKTGQAAEAESPTSRLAAMLKEALASNTIGGKPDDDSRLREVQEEVRQVQTQLSRLGLVPDEARRELTARFQRAAREINDRATRP